MANTPGVVVVYVSPPREPSILEMMLVMQFFMTYGARFTMEPNLLSFQMTDMPDSVNEYWMWIHARPWD